MFGGCTRESRICCGRGPCQLGYINQGQRLLVDVPEEVQTVASGRLHFGRRGRPASAAAAGAAGGLRSV
jgi:hypothetical protein